MTLPELPLVAPPLAKLSAPLIPFAPESAVRRLNAPLDFAVPKPDIIEIAPPAALHTQPASLLQFVNEVSV
jgi:hypothetical protein